jgi:hypothetical protein
MRLQGINLFDRTFHENIGDSQSMLRMHFIVRGVRVSNYFQFQRGNGQWRGNGHYNFNDGIAKLCEKNIFI